ncbi:MAG: hypothetical protein RLZZ91_1473 [Bacteroidota bacterium]|jgi:hypothetical protein
MYGIVNRAIEELIIERFGIEKWDEIKHKAGFNSEGFMTLKPYPDELTFKLVGAASVILNVPADTLLEAFGEYWILYTAEKGYGEMLNLAGDSFPSFLKNLNMLHGRVTNLMPELAPPQFECRNEKENSIELLYRSHRVGMIPMLYGLIKGLAKRFDKEVRIEEIQSSEDENTTVTFILTWS